MQLLYTNISCLFQSFLCEIKVYKYCEWKKGSQAGSAHSCLRTSLLWFSGRRRSLKEDKASTLPCSPETGRHMSWDFSAGVEHVHLQLTQKAHMSGFPAFSKAFSVSWPS